MKLLVINGPNLNLLGLREPDIYGKQTYAALQSLLQETARRLDVELTEMQSNHEGALIDALQQAYFDGFDGAVFNPGGYTHTKPN